jgi:hypothetical protein
MPLLPVWGYLVAHLAKPFERFLDGFCGVPAAVFAQGLQNRGHPTEVVPFQLHTDALQRLCEGSGVEYGQEDRECVGIKDGLL